VVTGGLSAGGASYIGGALTGAGAFTANNDITTAIGKFVTGANGQSVGMQLDSYVNAGSFNNYILNNSSAAGTYAALNFGRTTSVLYGFLRINNNTEAMEIGTAATTRLTIASTGAATFAGAVSGAAATFRPASDGVGLTLNQANSASAGWSFSALNTGSLAVTRVGGVAAMTCDLNGSTTFYTSGTQTFGAVVISSGNTLKLGNAYVAGAAVGTGTITIQDSTGTTYRIPVLV
jgi:hypothetical protein